MSSDSGDTKMADSTRQEARCINIRRALKECAFVTLLVMLYLGANILESRKDLPSVRVEKTTINLQQVYGNFMQTAPESPLTVLVTERVLPTRARGGLGDGASLTLEAPCRISFALEYRRLEPKDLRWEADKNVLFVNMPRLLIYYAEPRQAELRESRRSWGRLPRRRKTWDQLQQQALAELRRCALQESRNHYRKAKDCGRIELHNLFRSVLEGMGVRAEIRVESAEDM